MEEEFDLDLKFTDYKDLSPKEKKLFNEILKLKDEDFINL